MATRRRARDLQLLRDDIGPLIPSPLRASLPSSTLPGTRPVLILDVRRLQLLGVLTANAVGQLIWASGVGGPASALYSHRAGLLTLHEISRGSGLERLGADLEVASLPAFSGRGVRPWLCCPETGCGKHALKLYLSPRATTFCCRSCLGRQRPHSSLARLEQASTHHLRENIVAC
jgi:hypothetical protein